MRYLPLVERGAGNRVPRLQAVLREGRQFQFHLHGKAKRAVLGREHVPALDGVGKDTALIQKEETMKISNQPRFEYPVFGGVLTIPPGAFEVFSKKVLLESICNRVNQSLDKLFTGILKDPRGFPWAVVCTPDKADDSDNFSLSGMMGCNDTAQDLQVGQIGKRGIMDAFHDDSPHPGADVLELIRQGIADTPEVASLVDQMQMNFRAEWAEVANMLPAYLNALAEIKEYRIQNAMEAQENAIQKKQKAMARAAGGNDSFGSRMGMRVGLAAGGFVGVGVAKALPKVASGISTGLASMSASQAASRAEKDVTAWNISDDELGFFGPMNFYAWAQRVRGIVRDHYGKLQRVASEILIRREVPGWGSIAEMEEVASELKDKVPENYDKELCCQYMFARPYDVDMAVEIVSRYGAEAGGFRELQFDFGTDWTEKCDARVSDLCVDANPDDENDVKTRLEILTGTYLPGFYDGKSEFAEAKANRLREMLEKLDIRARTVGEMTCTTREAAAASRAERETVDSLVAAVRKYPFEELEKLIATLREAPCSSEYYHWVLEGLLKRRSFMLTVAGVEHPTWEEAQRAFDAKVEEVSGKKWVSSILRVATFGKDRQALATMYWPGSLDPDGVVSKVRNVHVADIKQAHEKLAGKLAALAFNPTKQAFSKMDAFMQDHVSAYGDARKKVVAKAQDISDVAKHNLKSTESEEPKDFKSQMFERLTNPLGSCKKTFSQMGAVTSAFMKVCGPKSGQGKTGDDRPQGN